MRRFVAGLALVFALAAPAGAIAHPLGNFTVNRYSGILLSGDRVYVRYVLDLAEIPTFQAKGDLEQLGEARYADRLVAELTRGIVLRIDGARRPLRPLRRAVSFPEGVSGLRTTRLEVIYDAGRAVRADEPLRLEYEDGNYGGRIGWREITLRAENGAGTVASTVPSESVSEELRTYPEDLLQSPLDVTAVEAGFTPGREAGVPPMLAAGDALRAPVRVAAASESGFASLISKENLSVGVVLISLLVAAFWGAAHALTPGHGKAIVAGYLVGARGKPRHAVMLGLIVTVTHTVGVFALGLVTLLLSHFVVPERLYPWLTVASGLLVVGVGAAVLRSRLAWRREGIGPGGQTHDHGDLPHSHAHGHAHAHGHTHGHDGGQERDGYDRRSLLGIGVAAGLLPCPSALVVLLSAIALHRIGFGLILILAFSVGLAATVTGIGLVAVLARRVFSRLSFEGRLIRALPAFSALVILGVGVGITVNALPDVL